MIFSLRFVAGTTPEQMHPIAVMEGSSPETTTPPIPGAGEK